MNLKQTIIHESLKLFSLKGFLSTSIDEILKASNASKGGFYNHFNSKEELFFQVLDEARSIWRERNLEGLDPNQNPITNIKQLLINFRDRYLKDSMDFPGGCVFIILMVELKNQRSHLAREINKGFVGLKGLIKRFLDQAKEAGELKKEADTEAMTEILFNGMLGATVTYNGTKSGPVLDQAINYLIEYIESYEP